jgi:two-component system OmpR family response regulator
MAAATQRTTTSMGKSEPGARNSSALRAHPPLIVGWHAGGMRVLVVEDQVKMASLIRRGLREEGLAADVAIKREQGVWAPVLMLTARDSVEDRVAGLDGGADDYLVKPFSFSELLARLRALGRRGPIERATMLRVGDLALDPAAHRAWRGQQEVDLSAKEFALLEIFMRRAGEVLSRYALLEHAWDYDYENRSNVVDVYVRYLRETVDRPFGVESIETVRGAGYRLRADGGV